MNEALRHQQSYIQNSRIRTPRIFAIFSPISIIANFYKLDILKIRKPCFQPVVPQRSLDDFEHPSVVSVELRISTVDKRITISHSATPRLGVMVAVCSTQSDLISTGDGVWGRGIFGGEGRSCAQFNN